ncbi:hypothetical protein LCGC14_1715600, partial [marine sediment metagenome]
MEFYEKCTACGGEGGGAEYHYEEEGVRKVGTLPCRPCKGTGKIMVDALSYEDVAALVALSKIAGTLEGPGCLETEAKIAYKIADAMGRQRRRAPAR